MSPASFDVAIIGAGIAGASAAYALSGRCKVALLEMESAPGYHTTGRSAAFFSEAYGAPAMRALTTASLEFFDHPPEGFAEHPLLKPSGALFIAREDQHRSVESFAAAMADSGLIELQDRDFALTHCPVLSHDYVAACLWEPGAREIDVHGLHQGFLRGARKRGAVLQVNAEVFGLTREAGAWRIKAGETECVAGVVVNAAGAWADKIAQLAGAAPIGLSPLRRSACILPGPQHTPRWPLVIDIDEEFYFKPDAGNILLSPADETLSEPCDAAPEDIDIAIAIARFERATTMQVTRVLRSWAGLRTVTKDRALALGFDPSVEGFFWLAGQGGQGIQTAPAAGRVAAALIAGEALPADMVARGVTLEALSPARFA